MDIFLLLESLDKILSILKKKLRPIVKVFLKFFTPENMDT